ncbi:MAG: helix-turn-helix domain-containing protein [Lachnospiraceae bacterium]|nr:helix-turn-helix domain-containing protein [Lachnospiraceae bacterium]
MYEIFEQLLQKNGVTAYKVAKEAGVTQTALSNWKSGKSTPTTKTLQRIADYFGVTIDYLMTGKKSEDSPGYYLNDDAREYAQFLFENPEYKVLFDASRKVKKEDIQFVKEMIDRVRGGDAYE